MALLRSERYLPVDVLVAKTDYQRTALGRARTHTLGPERAVVPVLSPENVIVHKLISGRAVDMDDVERILATKPSLDLSYVERWVAEWGLQEGWQKARGG